VAAAGMPRWRRRTQCWACVDTQDPGVRGDRKDGCGKGWPGTEQGGPMRARARKRAPSFFASLAAALLNVSRCSRGGIGAVGPG
jgi:hypothetical protein